MASVHDVAAFILEKHGRMSAMKLQKLVYYSQAWNLAWNDEPLFPERIQAWANGPVVRELYDHHRGSFSVSSWPHGSSANLTPAQKKTLETVLAFYGDKSPQWLSDLTHMEKPWRAARAGIPDGERSEQEITLESMADYYSSLPSTSNATA